MSNKEIKSLLVLLISKFDILENKIENIENKCKNVENLVNTLNSKNTLSSANNVDMIKNLNEKTNKALQKDFRVILNSMCKINDSYVYDILDETVTIYDKMTNIIYELNEMVDGEYFVVLSNNLYYWNSDKDTWNKINKLYLKELFDILRYKIIQKYQNLMLTNIKLKNECVDKGDVIYVDDNNFEKKNSEFKKGLISKFS